MWIVQLALQRPYTFVIMSMLIVILGALAIARMYGGISPEELAEVITRSRGTFMTVSEDSMPASSSIKASSSDCSP